MKLNIQQFAREASATTGVVYIICTIFVVLFPQFSLQLLGWLTHVMNIEIMERGIGVTFGSFLGGLGQVILYTYIAGGMFGLLFNRAVRS